MAPPPAGGRRKAHSRNLERQLALCQRAVEIAKQKGFLRGWIEKLVVSPAR